MSEGPPPGIGGLARRLGGRVKGALASSTDALAATRAQTGSAGAAGSDANNPAGGGHKGRLARIAAQRQQQQAAQVQLEQLTRERDQLREERLGIQQTLGAQHGKSVLPRLRVEKTNGTPSFVVGQRMMQRIYAHAADPGVGVDGIGGIFADRAGTARYARSHGVPLTDDPHTPAQARVVAHAFKGEVALVEVRGSEGVRHFEPDGTDPGDIRPAAIHDPELPRPERLEDLCAWSATLSRHIPRPYVQVHWAADGDEVLLHHLDVDPDRIPVLTPRWDERLGVAFDGAYSRYLKQPFLRGGLANQVPGGTFTPEEHA